MQVRECLNCGELYDVSKARETVPNAFNTTYCSKECLEASQKEMAEDAEALRATGFVVKDEPTPEQAAGKTLNEILNNFKRSQQAKGEALEPEDLA